MVLLRRLATEAGVCFHVAAVSDFTVTKTVGKISSARPVRLVLRPREKLYTAIKAINPQIFLITFKAEVGHSRSTLIRAAQEALSRGPMYVVIVNEVGRRDRGFEADINEVIVVKRSGKPRLLSLKTKRELAKEIVEMCLVGLDGSS